MAEELKRGRKKGGKNSHVEFSPGEVAFMRGLAAGKTIALAYKDACGAGIDPNHSGWQALRNIKRRAPEVMDELGLTMESLIRDLNDMRQATETKVFCNKGDVIYSDPLVAWEPRRAALDMGFRIHGAYAKPEADTVVQQLTQIKIIIEDVSREGMVKILEQTNQA